MYAATTKDEGNAVDGPFFSSLLDIPLDLDDNLCEAPRPSRQDGTGTVGS